MLKQEDSKSQSVGGVTIKTEPGTSTTPTMQRLPSLRPPRDLSLSAYSQKIPNLNQAKNKKVYIPNLNVQRSKQQTAQNPNTIKVEPVKPNLPDKSERGRGRGKRNLIQLNQGVFAEGVPGLKNMGRGRNSGGNEESLKKPTLKLKENLKIDKEKEENTMKQLLRDDFIDDPTLEPDFENCPITLPLLNAKEDPGLKKKCDMKPTDTKENLTINSIFNEDVQLPDPGFIFIQLPSSMPGLKAEQPDGAKHNPQSSSSTENAKPTEGERCVLSALPGGKIGKLQMLKSGRARLVFGETKMWLEMGTQVAFRQDLVSVDLDKETHTGHMVNLGLINARMVAAPDWEAMVARPNATSV